MEINRCYAPFCRNSECTVTEMDFNCNYYIADKYAVYCSYCECRGPARSTKELAIEAWNCVEDK